MSRLLHRLADTCHGSGMTTAVAQLNMALPQRLLSRSAIGAIDQGLLSAFNLALGVAFIKLATKADYADYALMATALLLVQSVQNALVNSPLATLMPAETNRPRHEAIVNAGAWVQQSLAGVIFLVGGFWPQPVLGLWGRIWAGWWPPAPWRLQGCYRVSSFALAFFYGTTPWGR